MRKAINDYEGIMISKILSCKTTFDVLAIIDKKVDLIQKRTGEKAILRRFIDNSLFDLRKVKDKDAGPNEVSKIRAAIAICKAWKCIIKLIDYELSKRKGTYLCK